MLHLLIDGIRGINHRQVLGKDRLVVIVGATHELDALHLVFQRGQHSRELTRLLIGRDVNEISVIVVATGTIGRALDAVAGTLHGDVLSAEGAVAVAVDNIVERALRLLAQAELDGGLTQAVYAAVEAYGLVQVGEAAVDTAGDVDQRGVDEVDGLGTLEVVGRAV